jgi:myo-inositol 2-dehydrogenase/D-chiro-inositol 1-dehydrogenase
MSFKICMIGCGEIANGYHGPAYRKYALEHANVELSACCDRNIPKAAQFAERFGFSRYYTDFAKMLKTERPDAICLSVQPDFTCEISCAILGMGIPLLLEKPPGMTIEETDRMIAAAAESGTPNQVAFNRRFTPLVSELKGILEKRLSPEDIQYVRYDLTRVNRTDRDFSTTAIHGIDTARFIASSDYAYVRFHYQEFSVLGQGVANIFMDCTFQSGATAQLDFCPLAGVVTERVAVHASDNTCFLNLPVWNAFDTPGRLMHFEKEQLIRDVAGPEVSGSNEDYILNGFYSENESFFNDIRNGFLPTVDIKSGRQSVEIAQLIRERAVEYVPH